jgi:hypothetical protein
MQTIIPTGKSVNNLSVKFDFGPYNFRRYSKPWGAVVTFDGVKAQYDFSRGAYLGDDMGGKVVIACSPGDIVAKGQRDNRKPKHTDNTWYVVDDDGSTRAIDRAAAFEHWQNRQI